ncbi:tetratricopeptide repeat protein [Phormidium sp. LEGE 05292]|uniref:tetratricopeptide repeat protein n=1 Tax=[Phormidium] sp. LEGE 05292 TaxID=767427 RepID=UPI00187DF227|nr:tetratricopeptide repeat protein [Phormidium sp. LEGE 05292]MBE9228272.1 tetratricopeptide repeat protein [Phormidium sp. LEGE 05292]
MIYLVQLLVSLCITLALIIYSPPATALTLANSSVQMSAQEFFRAGVEQMQSQNYSEAVQDFTDAIELKHDFFAAFSNRCLAYLQLGEYESAVQDCTEAVSLNSQNVESFLNRGLAYYKQGNYQSAIADYNQVIKLKPIDFRAYYNRALAKSDLQSYQEAMSDYNHALSLMPVQDTFQLAEVYNDRGTNRLMLNDNLGAIADFDQAIHLNQQDYRLYFNRACANQRISNYTAAIQDLTIALKLNPNYAEAYASRGIAHYKLGDERQALLDLQKAAQNFLFQENVTAYQQTLDLLKQLKGEETVIA